MYKMYKSELLKANTPETTIHITKKNFSNYSRSPFMLPIPKAIPFLQNNHPTDSYSNLFLSFCMI